MTILRNVLAAAILLLEFGGMPALAGFLQFPLHCSTPLVNGVCPATSIDYTVHGAYSQGAMISVLDHSMKLNATNYYPYGKVSNSGGNGVITAFNGESVSGIAKPTDETCIGGTINLHPDWNTSVRMTNDNGCGTGYSSYDEHPGYDYKASLGTPVYAAQAGTVISTICYKGNSFPAADSCASWGALAIRPTVASGGNNYFYQYMHLDTMISVVPGQSISAGQQIGTVGARCNGCSPAIGAHLHFEVRYIPTSIGSETYPIVDPYGWVGGGIDPLYSRSVVVPTNLWQ